MINKTDTHLDFLLLKHIRSFLNATSTSYFIDFSTLQILIINTEKNYSYPSAGKSFHKYEEMSWALFPQPTVEEKKQNCWYPKEYLY